MPPTSLCQALWCVSAIAFQAGVGVVVLIWEAASMLVQPTSRLIVACTDFFRTVISTVISVGYAALVRWRSGVAELKHIFIMTSFGRTVMAVVLALVSLSA